MSIDWFEKADINRPGVVIHEGHWIKPGRHFSEHGVDWSIAGRFSNTRTHCHRPEGDLEVRVSESKRTWEIARWVKRTKRGGKVVSDLVVEQSSDAPAESVSDARKAGLEAFKRFIEQEQA